MSALSPHPAREVARAVAGAGWPVIPIATSTDEKMPVVAWKSDPTWVCWTDDDVIGKWPPRWPRWAAICGVPRERDGRALACADADSQRAADVARSLLPGHTRVRTGRSDGEHTWFSIPPSLQDGLLTRFYISADLDWRGGDCIALLPGSQWAPVSAPQVVYTHIAGPALPEVLDVPVALAEVIAELARAAGAVRPAMSVVGAGVRAADAGAGRPFVPLTDPDLSAGGAFEKFLAVVASKGRIVKRTRKPSEAFVQCPGKGHPDQNRNRPCLHVTARGPGIGLHCFGNRGCTTEEIISALGLELSDLYDPLQLRVHLIDDLEARGR